jgi:DNA-binding transcriptional LysR family regulator
MTIYGKIDNLNDITIFVEVAERRSFTRAAKSAYQHLG